MHLSHDEYMEEDAIFTDWVIHFIQMEEEENAILQAKLAGATIE